MRRLSLTQGRLVLVLDDQRPLRAAAYAVPTARFEGAADGMMVFSYEATPAVATELARSLEPALGDGAQAIMDLLSAQERLEAVAAAKGSLADGAALVVDLRTDPMAHQREAMAFCLERFRAGATGSALLMEQGTGKSLVAIGLANALHRAGLIRWALVVAPNSLRGTWGGEHGEIAKHSGVEFDVCTPRGSRTDRARQIADAVSLAQPGRLMWVILNYDTLAIDPRDGFAQDLARIAARAPGLLVADESTLVKNPQAKRTRSLLQLAAQMPYRLILTGTPVTRSPLDVYSQFEMLAPGALGFRSFRAFERQYAVMSQRQVAGRRFQEVVGYQNLDDLERRVAGLSYRVRAQDCLDLPEVVARTIPVVLTQEQSRAIRSLQSDMLAELDGGAVLDGRNILTRYLRMGQILGGFAGSTDDDGAQHVHAFDPNPKLEALLEYLGLLFEDARKAVVFCQYRAEILAICAEAEKRGWNPVRFFGGVSEQQRELGLRRFKTDPDCRLFVAQYQTGSKGLTLVEASDIIFYSLSFGLEDYLQARKRVHRIGQRRSVTECYLVAQHPTGKQTLDHVIAEALRSKRSLADLVTGDAARRVMEAV